MSETIAENGVETEPQFFHYDGNGNVTALTDDRGNQTATYRYDAFGNSLVTQGEKAVENEYRFSTKPLDEVSGLYYYGYRYYDPVTGRWPSRDPIEENGGINLYGFVRNNSVNQWDYLGLKEDWCDECDEALKKSLSSARNKKSIAAIEELNREKGGSKCPLPEFSCVCCKENKDRGPNDPQRAGDYDPSTGQVRICCNNDHSGPEGVDAVVRHELVHAFDKCSGFDLNDCNDSACSEIRAYESQGVPRSLIVEYATRSVATNPKCKDKAREIVESQMERCLGTVNE